MKQILFRGHEMKKISYIIATNEAEFANYLQSILYSEATVVAHDNTRYMTVQFSKAPADKIWDKVKSYMRTDGQYVYYGEFVRDTDIYNMIEPYCKQVDIDIVPVDVQKLSRAKVLEYIDPINLTHIV